MKFCSAERLLFAGFDFKCNEEKWYVLEANPMPGYDFFDRKCQNRISKKLLQLLTKVSILTRFSIVNRQQKCRSGTSLHHLMILSDFTEVKQSWELLSWYTADQL